MSSYDYDVLVIGGGGSGGFTAVTTAMKRGVKVGMVERGRLGGLCILAGCMPSKTLLHAASGVKASGGDGRAVYPRVLAAKRATVDHLAGNRDQAVAAKEAQGLEVLRGQARLADPHTVEVDGRAVTARSIVVATGSQEMIPAVEGLAESGYLTSDSLMELPELPKSMVVLGGGTMAVEMAQYLARMGVALTVIQRSATLLSDQRPEVGQVLAEALAADGAEVVTNTELRSVSRHGGGVTVDYLRQGRPAQAQAQELLLCLGRVPATGGLGLAEAGVEMGRRGQVVVDQHMATSQSHIFAAGDCTGGLMVVNLAVEQGRTAGANAADPAGPRRGVADRVIPRAVFTDPQLASVGLSAAQAEAQGLDCAEARYDLDDMGVARTYPEGVRGFMVMRADRATGRIVGAELLAPEASLMIHAVAVAMAADLGPGAITAVPFIHPCLAEVVELCAGRLERALKKG